MTPLLASLLLVLCPRAQAQAGWAGGESLDEGRAEAWRAESRPRPLALLTEEELEVESDVAEVEVGAGVTLLGTAVALLTLAVVGGYASQIRETRCSSWPGTGCFTELVGHDATLLGLAIASAAGALVAILVGGPGLLRSAVSRGRRVRREREQRAIELNGGPTSSPWGWGAGASVSLAF